MCRPQACPPWASTLSPPPPAANGLVWSTRSLQIECGRMDWRLELVQVPVSDVDRAKAFYTEKAGFNADHDHRVSDDIRFVQLTPPGSACSIAIGTGLGEMRPGAVQGLQMVVPDIQAARAELLERGVEVGAVQDFPWGSFVFFSDPDGNGWAVQQVPARDEADG
jgi:predicted enzyme related to lactoylglutathione lyase